mmetsp:Transcript_15413/g.46529  ORF Transcript_15413/g.46529 Transcript_15413/m.46529 type:complete len:291 (-) Transcript_15413:1990-2862(-)|eukprot:CAMPEP_0206140150 /NCGR_PEP_ID=MMETSP1473-20131121/8605_1 /ASSEMBLY_ACC=CAM_ASM_001109 /TAXON_ID=1461547 /ORGANISM="Stichococcus sp, Strain RCC1054" /LENGTH=290 /DNA_ID=CAMNT_0053534207 /DNA_START=229 /DNA_END=1101 /DNA_ORIENTATION=+
MFYACIDQAHVGIIERFGKFEKLAQPGFNCVCCCLGQSKAGELSLRVQQLDVHVDTKTRDNVFVQIVVSIQYIVIKEQVYDAFYKLTNSQAQIRAYVFDNVRASVPLMDLDDVFIAKETIARGVKEELSKAMNSFGYQIVQALVTDIVPDGKVRAAMNEINAAQRLRVATLEKSEALKIQVVKAAEAESEAKFLQGQGIARQRQAIVNGLRDSVLQFSSEVDDIDSKAVIEMMMLTQYFDMLKDVGTHGGNSSLFIPHSAGGANDALATIRNGFLQGSQGAALQQQGMQR